MRIAVLLLFSVTAAPAGILQQAPDSIVANPYAGNEDARRAGEKLYNRHCAQCHGQSGEGIGKTPPVKTPVVRQASPGALFWVLRNGSRWRGMPSFTNLPEEQRWQSIAFMNSF